MALIIEDGGIVANANSYITLDEIRAFSLLRGTDLSGVADADLEVYAILAMDYLESLRYKYQGEMSEPETQVLQWPRKYVIINCIEFSSEAIPTELKNAQSQLIIEQYNGIELMPTKGNSFLTRKKFDVMEEEYSDDKISSIIPTMSSVNVWLDPLFSACGPPRPLKTIRV